MSNRLSPSLRLALIYLLVSATWILVSDSVLYQISSDAATTALLQSVKGLLFVLTCTLLIFFVSRRFYGDINRSLMQSEELLRKYQALNEASKEGIIDYDIASDTASINEQLRQFLGLPTTEIVSFSTLHKKWIHPEDLQRVMRSFEETLASNSTVWHAEYKVRWHDGRYRDVINKGCILREKRSGVAQRFICTLQDVSELRHMQAHMYEQRLQNKLSLGRSIIKAQEEERNRWATELHDNVCQVLTVVKLYLSELSSGRPLPAAVAGRPQVLVEKALNEIRQLSASIRPPEFATISLREAVEQLVCSIQRVKQYSFHLQFDNLQEERLSEQHKLMVYRVIQEQVSNIVKYAEPENIEICVENKEDLVTINVADDGRGFDVTARTGGIGLRNIQSRLQIYSGFMKVESAPNKGCSLYAQFHLN